MGATAQILNILNCRTWGLNTVATGQVGSSAVLLDTTGLKGLIWEIRGLWSTSTCLDDHQGDGDCC